MKRKKLLPHVGPVCPAEELFSDKKIQNVLLTRFSTDWDWCFCKTEEHAQAWPLIVFSTIGSTMARPNRDDFIQCYALDPVFSAALLHEMTQFMFRPESKWSVVRRAEFLGIENWSFADMVDTLSNNPQSKKMRTRNSRVASNKFNIEIRAREAIAEKWKVHFEKASALSLSDYPLHFIKTPPK